MGNALPPGRLSFSLLLGLLPVHIMLPASRDSTRGTEYITGTFHPARLTPSSKTRLTSDTYCVLPRLCATQTASLSCSLPQTAQQQVFAPVPSLPSNSMYAPWTNAARSSIMPTHLHPHPLRIFDQVLLTFSARHFSRCIL
ncbi:uncharacterized protein EI97DRAFT_434871 [Westerdykella ornata]|uniref:Secreted protein n=1 Tax=Westerdykella ornata TaxID=318751 RepID=A0A6A6JF70_WESOR|nr:uncharacterized protein EI97DRAFT_434871 [Westerdykella ornata]KAF2274638.1 hypothetical protein EI97DRAFT_434871 [Westerdykella ornata]